MCPLTLMALRTIMMASCSDRSVSSVNCSAPPLRMMVHVFAFGQPLKKLYLQTQTWWVLVPGLLFRCYSLKRTGKTFELVSLTSLLRPGPLRRLHTVPGHRLSSHLLRSGWSRHRPGGHITHSQSCSCQYQQKKCGFVTQLWTFKMGILHSCTDIFFCYCKSILSICLNFDCPVRTLNILAISS